MLPQILQQLAGASPIAGNLSQLKGIIGMLKGGNPQAIVQNAMQSNPQLRQILQQYNGDAKQAFYGLARQNWIDADEIIGMLK